MSQVCLSRISNFADQVSVLDKYILFACKRPVLVVSMPEFAMGWSQFSYWSWLNLLKHQQILMWTPKMDGIRRNDRVPSPSRAHRCARPRLIHSEPCSTMVSPGTGGPGIHLTSSQSLTGGWGRKNYGIQIQIDGEKTVFKEQTWTHISENLEVIHHGPFWFLSFCPTLKRWFDGKHDPLVTFLDLVAAIVHGHPALVSRD